MNKKMIGFFALAIFITGSVFILMSNNDVKNDSVTGGYKNTKDNTLQPVNTTSPAPSSKADNTSSPAVAPTKATTNTTAPVKTVNPAPTGFTLSDVQNHNSSSNCWTAVYDSVYDVTSFISQHPGGSRAIISLCGKDGTSAFDDQHGGQRRANAELANHKIGTLLK